MAPLLDFQPKTPAAINVGEETTSTPTDSSSPKAQRKDLPVAACYIVKNGRLLMVRRRRREGTLEWAGPSGTIEPGETPEEAAVREVREEVGVTIEVERRLGERDHPATGRHLIYLVCRIVDGEPKLIDHEEISAIEWADLATVKERWSTLKGGIFPPVVEYLERTMAPETPAKPLVIPADLKPLAGAIIVRGDRALLTERRFPGFGEQWSWPSGQIEHGESLEDAILRELHEELLIEGARVVSSLGDIDLPSGFRMSHFHVVVPDEAEPKLNDYEQLVRFAWMTRDETEKAFKSLHPSIASRALDFLDQVLDATKAQDEASVKQR